MNVFEMIKALEKMGFKVDARRRSDGGWIITKINDMTFTGAKGNQYARNVLGVELSQARIEQTHFNVTKYIKGFKKPKTKVDEEMQKELEKVQRVWRKNKVDGKITKRKLRWHIEHEGRRAAKDYLKKMTRYGKGLAYLENVTSVANYMRDFSKSLPDKEVAQGYIDLAKRLEDKAESVTEEQLKRVLEVLYDVREMGYTKEAALQGLQKLISIIL